MKPGIEFNPRTEIKRIDNGVRKAFGKFGRDFTKFQGYVDKRLNNLKLTDKKTTELFDFYKKFQELKVLVAHLKEEFESLAKKNKVEEELRVLNKRFSDFVEAKDFNAAVKKIDDDLSVRNVRRIDLAKVETRVNVFRKEIEDLQYLDKVVNKLREDFLDFKEKALTKYHINKHEAWVKEIERDVLELAKLNKKVDLLCSIGEVDKIRKDIKDLKKDLKSYNSRLDKIEKRLDKCEKQKAKVKEVKVKVKPEKKKTERKIKENKSKKTESKNRKKKKLKNNFGSKFYDWLMEEE